MLLSYCVVNTNGRELLLACLEAIERTDPARSRARDPGARQRLRRRLRRGGASSWAADIRLIALDRREGKAANDSRLLAGGARRVLPAAQRGLRAPARSRGRSAGGAASRTASAAVAGAQLLAPDGRPVPCAWRLPSVGDRAGGRALPAPPVDGRERRRADPPGRLGAVERDAGPPRGRRAGRLASIRDFFVYSDETDFCKRLWRRRLAGSSTSLRRGRSTTTRWRRTPPGPSGASSSTTATATATCASTSAAVRGCSAAAAARLAVPAARRRGPRPPRALRRGATGSTRARRCFPGRGEGIREAAEAYNRDLDSEA